MGKRKILKSILLGLLNLLQAMLLPLFDKFLVGVDEGLLFN